MGCFFFGGEISALQIRLGCNPGCNGNLYIFSNLNLYIRLLFVFELIFLGNMLKVDKTFLKELSF